MISGERPRGERGRFSGKRPILSGKRPILWKEADFEWKEAEFTKFLTFDSINTSDVNQMC